jgi:hypothetical protein
MVYQLKLTCWEVPGLRAMIVWASKEPSMMSNAKKKMDGKNEREG